MKNSLANFPGLKNMINYWHAIGHKLRSKKLKIGFNNELRSVTFGRNVALGKNVSIYGCELGDFTYVSEGTYIRKTTVGKFGAIGPYCQIGLGKHPTENFISSHPLFYSARPQVGFAVLKESNYKEFDEITIGNDVWIGAGVIILDGIKIGDGAVIAAGAVVTKDVAPYSVVAGIPAVHKKFKFSEEKIQQILKEPWWEKDFEWIKENMILNDNYLSGE